MRKARRRAAARPSALLARIPERPAARAATGMIPGRRKPADTKAFSRAVPAPATARIGRFSGRSTSCRRAAAGNHVMVLPARPVSESLCTKVLSPMRFPGAAMFGSRPSPRGPMPARCSFSRIPVCRYAILKIELQSLIRHGPFPAVRRRTVGVSTLPAGISAASTGASPSRTIAITIARPTPLIK